MQDDMDRNLTTIEVTNEAVYDQERINNRVD